MSFTSLGVFGFADGEDEWWAAAAKRGDRGDDGGDDNRRDAAAAARSERAASRRPLRSVIAWCFASAIKRARPEADDDTEGDRRDDAAVAVADAFGFTAARRRWV